MPRRGSCVVDLTDPVRLPTFRATMLAVCRIDATSHTATRAAREQWHRLAWNGSCRSSARSQEAVHPH
jgi:hypothetical protein